MVLYLQSKLIMKGLKHILLEGRVEDAQKYFENAVGSWPLAEPGNPAGVGVDTNLEGVLDHFVSEDPSGNHKYLMWMIKTYLNEESTAPFEITSVVRRFHKNVGRLTQQLISDMDIFSPDSRIAKSPKNIDSYDDISQLERVMDEVGRKMTRKQREKDAKTGAEKLYEDDRWLVMKPTTKEASCYYGAGTKWCTAAKNHNQFERYNEKGNLYYIIDKSRKEGSYYKIAFYIDWGGEVYVYDEEDNRLVGDVYVSVKTLLPIELMKAINQDMSESKPQKVILTLQEFQDELYNYIINSSEIFKIHTKLSGSWELDVNSEMSGAWNIFSLESNVSMYATPFWDGEYMIPVDSEEMKHESGDDTWGVTLGTNNHVLPPYDEFEKEYLTPGNWEAPKNDIMQKFINIYFTGLKNHVLNRQDVIDAVGTESTTWSTGTPNFKFTYPPREGTLTQKFVDYIKENPNATSNQFYIDIIGRERPRGHNASFFNAIKDSGIVSVKRIGRSRQFGYTLGPNYEAWTQGKLVRI